MNTMFKRGEHVRYKAGGKIFKAIVRQLHRDGLVTVEATFPEGGKHYLGYRYRLRPSDLIRGGA